MDEPKTPPVQIIDDPHPKVEVRPEDRQAAYVVYHASYGKRSPYALSEIERDYYLDTIGG